MKKLACPVFPVLVTCFAIFLVTVLGQKKTRIDLANEQFGKIMDVLGKWEGRENWLNEHIEEKIREVKTKDYFNFLTVTGSQNVEPVHFRRFWLELEKTNHESQERQKTGEVRKTGQRVPDCSLVSRGSADERPVFLEYFCIPAFLNDVPLTIRVYDAFKKEFGVDGVKWKLRPFEELFPELDEMAKNYMGLDVEVVKSILEERANSEKGEQFEIWGASIPGREISRWGILIIFVVQLYFLLHLSPLPSLMEKTVQLPIVPWTGLYSGWLSKTVFLSLGFLFPTGVLLKLLLNFARFQGKESNLVLIGVYTIFGLSLAVTSAAIVKIFRFQRIYAEKEAEISKNCNTNKIKINGEKNA